MQSVAGTPEKQVIAFDTEQDRVKGFYQLLLSNTRFRGVGKNKFVITREQCTMLQSKGTRYHKVE